MRLNLAAYFGCFCFFGGLVVAQTPPISATIRCEERDRVFEGNIQTLGHPYWARVINSGSAYWNVSTVITMFGSPAWVQSTDIALFDATGNLLFENHFASPTLPYSAFVFGTAWSQGVPGSPQMLISGQDYYLGVAGGGSVFSDGFNCNMSSDRGRIAGGGSPSPGAGVTMLLGSGVFLRRKR